MLKRMGVALLIIAASTFGAQSQDTTEQAEVSLQTLLNSGFTIVAMHYLNQSMVFTLQRHTVAYVCDTNLNGETKICIRLK